MDCFVKNYLHHHHTLTHIYILNTPRIAYYTRIEIFKLKWQQIEWKWTKKRRRRRMDEWMNENRIKFWLLKILVAYNFTQNWLHIFRRVNAIWIQKIDLNFKNGKSEDADLKRHRRKKCKWGEYVATEWLSWNI